LKQIRRHVTYANVMSSLAVFLILGGATAFAATKIGANEIKANSIKTGKIVKEAVTAGKIKKNAVTETRIADGAVTTNKLADNAVTTPKIANDAVTTGKVATDAITAGKLANEAVSAGKLATSERSEVISSSASSSFDFVDTYNPATWTTVMSLNLPSGNWVVTANIGVAIGGATTHIGCRLNQGGTVLAQSGTQGEVAGIVPSIDGVDLAAVAGGGQVTVTCGDNVNGTSAINRSLIAIRAGSVTPG
jgi:hypothetical protein